MKPRLQDVLERLEPPPGGLAGLRARMAEPERPPAASPLRPLGGIAAAACAAALATLVVLSALERPAPRPAPAATVAPPAASVAAAPEARLPGFHPAFAALGLEPLPTEPVTVAAEDADRLAVQRVPVADDRVVFYLVATVEPYGSRSACQNDSDSSGGNGCR